MYDMHADMYHATGTELWDQGKASNEVGVQSPPAGAGAAAPLSLQAVLDVAAPDR